MKVLFNLSLAKLLILFLSNPQHGFKSKRSVETNLMNLSITVHDALVKKQQVDIFYGDFENAFDKVWHRMLIIKMRKEIFCAN